MADNRIRELATVYLEIKKALDTAFSVPGVLEEARRLEKRHVGRPRKVDETLDEVVRDALIKQCRKNGKSVAWIAEWMGTSDRYINKCIEAKKRYPRTKLK